MKMVYLTCIRFVLIIIFAIGLSSCLNTCATVSCDEGQKCVNGKCTTNDKSCPLNEEFKECGSNCEQKCLNYDPHEKPSNSIIKLNICDGKCIPNVCQCQKSFVRHSSGFCIIPSDCRPHNLGRRR